MRTIVRVIDSISERTGKTTRWLCAVLVVVMTYEVIMRFVFNSPTMWAYETSLMLGCAIYAFGWSYAHRHGAHVRVDVLYTRLGLRGRAIIDVVCALLLFCPLIILLMGTSIAEARDAWVVSERMVLTYWYPPAAPLRTVVAIGFCLFALQGVAQIIRDLYLLVRNKTL